MLGESPAQGVEGRRRQHRLDRHEECALLEANVIVEKGPDLLQEGAEVFWGGHRRRQRAREAVEVRVLLPDPRGALGIRALAAGKQDILLVRHVSQELVPMEGEIGSGRPGRGPGTGLGRDAVAGPAEGLGLDEGGVMVAGKGNEGGVPREPLRPRRILRRPSASHGRHYDAGGRGGMRYHDPMLGRDRPSSVLCPSCGSLVGVKDERCLTCGRLRPGMFGFGPLLRAIGGDMGFVSLVMWACGAVYIATLAVDRDAGGSEGLLSFLSPSGSSLFLFGASGATAVFGYGRWWTVLSAGWLHGGLLHIGFNMMALRDLGPLATHLYGTARTFIIYTVAGVAGFLASSVAGYVLRGGGLTVGASAALFGLIGALLYYGRRGGSRALRDAAIRWAIGGLAFGFFIPGIDNWAHLGGLAGGYLASRWLDPLLPERGDHVLMALLCVVVSAAAIVASVVAGLPARG